MANALVVVDLSHWNTVTDLHAAAASGIVGIIHKCTEGTGFLDKTYHTRRQMADEAGLAFAAYHFLKHGNVAAQIGWFLDNCKLPTGGRACIDYEDAACTLDDLHQAVEALRVEAPDLEITIYSGHLIKEQLGSSSDEVLDDTSLWIAQYTSAAAPSWPKGTWSTWSLWQYTDKASVPGIKGGCDGNRFNGTAEQCRKWFGPVDYPMPQPEPEPERSPVIVSVQTPPDVEVQVIINGKVVAA